ncbi:MAG: bifunctional demethylmenaquinone methyltransferase/2-methoxy-6-polyprenyl-1,4-benzoquinol methylase UbiE [Thermogutta sp.]
MHRQNAELVDKSSQRIRRMFAEIAPRYDLLNHLLSLGTDVYWRWRTVRASRARGTGPILDLCCGTGDLALAFWQSAGHRFPVIGVDFCRPMVELAKQKAERRRASVHFIEADGLHLPFPDGTFAVVAVAFGLRNMASTAQALSEMVRVCRRGGEVMVLEFTLPTVFPLNVIYRVYFRFLLPTIGQMLAPNREAAYNYLPASVIDFPQGASLLAEMRKAGLNDLTVQPLTFGIAALYKGTK